MLVLLVHPHLLLLCIFFLSVNRAALSLTIGSAGFFLHNSVSPFSKVGVTVLVR